VKVQATFLDAWVKVGVGNIVTEAVDVIVNAANSMLSGGSGVDGAIHKAGGPIILEECQKIRAMKFPDGMPTGDACATQAGKLNAKWIVHTAGPIFGHWDGKEAEMLRSCYWNSLVLSRELGAARVAFPAISTGVYGYPREMAAEVVSRTLTAIRPSIPGIKEVLLVFHSDDDAFIFLENEKFPRAIS